MVIREKISELLSLLKRKKYCITRIFSLVVRDEMTFRVAREINGIAKTLACQDYEAEF